MRLIITEELEFKMNETDWNREYTYLKAVLLSSRSTPPYFYMMFALKTFCHEKHGIKYKTIIPNIMGDPIIRG